MLIVELKGQRGPEELHWATQYGGHQSLASDCLGREPNQRESNQQQQLQLYTKQDKEQTFGPLRLPSLLVCSTVGLIILLGTTSLGAHARLDSYNTHKSEPVDPRNDLEYTKYTRKLIPPSNEQPSVGQPASIGRRRLRRAEAKPDGGPIITTSTTTTPKPSLPPTLPAVQTSIAPKHSTTLKPATTPTFHTTHTTNPSHVTSSTTRAPTTTLAPSSNHTTSKTNRLPLPPTDDGDEWEIDGKPQMLKDLLARLGEKGKKVFENIQSAFKDLNAVREMLPKVVAAKDGRYEARDVALFLDSHRSHALNDPRVHFTQQPMLSAAFKLQLDVVKVPAKLRFAYVLRSINELGRKIASRMSAYFVGMVRVLKKQPDGLGAKPELADYHEALLHAFNTDDEPSLTAADQQVKFPSSPAGAALGLDAFLSLLPGQQHQQQHLGAIGQLVGADEKKRTMLNRSLTDLSLGLAQTIITLLQTPSPNAALANKKAITVVGEALKNGAKTMVDLMKKNDKFKPEWEAVSHMNKILNKTIGAMWELTNHQNASKLFLAHSSQPNPLNLTGTINKLSAVKSGGLSDSTGLQGAWNSFLFDNLGTSERVVRVFAWLLGSFTETKAKTRFVNMYMAQVRAELAKTMSSFVALQAGPQLDLVASDQYLLADSNHTWSSSNSSGSSKSSPHPDYQLDKGRLPARCYLAGRRWRLLIIKATKHYDQQDDIISAFVDQIGQLKANYVNQPSMELERICLPRLEMGVKGWGINGEPAGDVNAAQNKFPLRNPIEGLNKDEDPFTGGARMGYRLGFMIGYNEKRNQSLEMEAGPRSSPIAFVVEVQKQHNYALNSTSTTMTTQSSNTINSSGANKTEEAKKKRDNEIDYLAKASYRQAITVGARKALEIGCREGYMATLRVSLRAGMLLPLEAGTSLASLKGANFASQAGAEAGRTFVNKYLIERDNMDDKVRGELLELGKLHGSLAGREIGETIGAIVGHEAALEAYRRAITRGGKITRAKFHLDEYLAGAMVGFDFGLAEGNRVAQSNNIDPSAPKFFKLTKPNFSAKISAAFGPAPTKDTKTTATTNKPDKGNSKQAPLQQSASPSNSTKTKDASPAPASRSALIELPASLPTTSVSSKASTNHWELELITPLTDKNIEDFHRTRNHTRVTGTFKGTYTVAKEIKKGLQRVSLANLTYNLEINALGFAMNDIAYLSLSGTINKANVLHGSLIATDIVKK